MGRDEQTSRFSFLRTLAVIALLLFAAAVMSYLWAYALSDALVAGHLTSPSDSDLDTRPEQMKWAFGIILSILLLIVGWLKWTSSRQIRRIDAMNRE